MCDVLALSVFFEFNLLLASGCSSGVGDWAGFHFLQIG